MRSMWCGCFWLIVWHCSAVAGGACLGMQAGAVVGAGVLLRELFGVLKVLCWLVAVLVWRC